MARDGDGRLVGDRLTQRQRDALWTWTWLGWRDSTPAFKACVALGLLALIAIIAYAALGT